MSRHIGIVVEDRGSAIVTIERGEDDSILCNGIERHPFDVGTVAARVRELDEPKTSWALDAEGLGGALWTIVGDGTDRWHLYQGRGIERQALVDALVVAIEQDRFRFAAGLAEQEAMTKALTSYRRQVRDDGVIGSELVVALLLAIIPPPKYELIILA
jgi:hypothetical protein